MGKDWIDNITDKNIIQDNLTFVSMFIAVYENMVDYVVSSVKDYLCSFGIEDGKAVYINTSQYKSQILNRIVDEKGNKDKTKATFLWLVDNNAITREEYEQWLALKMTRNKYAHELSTIILEGIDESEFALLFKLQSIYSKISKWVFTEIEAPIAGYEIAENADIEGIQSTINYVFDIMLDVLYNEKSEEYKSIIDAMRKSFI